jgi:hypothetical protein
MYVIETAKAHNGQLSHDDGHSNDFDFYLSCCYCPKSVVCCFLEI